MNKRKEYLIVALFLVIFFALALHSITQKSIINDELVHITAGYSYLKTGDFRLNTEHPPLIKIISAIPLLFLNPHLPLEDPAWEAALTQPITQWNLGARFFFTYNNNPDQILFWARLPMLLIGLLLGIYLYKWAKELYGQKAGFLALLLFTFSPNLLANTRLVTTDMGVTTFIFITFYYIWKYNQTNTKKYLYLSGLFFGLTLASKYTALYFIPIIAVLCLYEAGKNKKKLIQQTKNFSILMLIAIAILILSYGIVNFPKFLTGLLQVTIHSVVGHRSYLFGTFSETGFLYYYPLVFLIKTPIATIALIILTIILARKVKQKNENMYFLIIISLFILITIINKINIGLRHILPIYPFLFLYCSKITKTKFKAKNVILIALAIFYIFSTLNAHPHYLPYFNEAIGQENGYKYVIDSNIDWGQDLKGLKKYMVKNNIPKIKMAYFGVGSRDYRNIEWEEVSCKPQTGLIAVSANQLTGFTPKDHTCLWWLRESQPIDNIGYSIFIYNLTTEQVNSFLQLSCQQTCENKCQEVEKTFEHSFYNETCRCNCT